MAAELGIATEYLPLRLLEMSGREYSNILLVYPELCVAESSSSYSTSVLGEKSFQPPLGLMTIAALTPRNYNLRLLDLNFDSLADEDIQWADMICFSAMLSQKTTLFRVASRCRAAGKLVVFGGPYPTVCPEECRNFCDVLVLNEAELTWNVFLKDLERGELDQIYTSHEKADIRKTPVPRFDLVDLKRYFSIPVQYSRGCTLESGSGDMTVMFGEKQRAKTPAQFLAELDALHSAGYRGSVFIVDDNFIGNKESMMELLTLLICWNLTHGYPFTFSTQASIDLAEESEAMKAMVKARFTEVILGIEAGTAFGELRRGSGYPGRLAESVAAVREAGLKVNGGFVFGFDNSATDIFDRQIELAKQADIPISIFGPLVALPGTPLYHKLKKCGQLLENGQDDSLILASAGYVKKTVPDYLRKNFSMALERSLRTQKKVGATPDGSKRRMLGKVLMFLSVNSPSEASCVSHLSYTCLCVPEKRQKKQENSLRDVISRAGSSASHQRVPTISGMRHFSLRLKVS